MDSDQQRSRRLLSKAIKVSDVKFGLLLSLFVTVQKQKLTLVKPSVNKLCRAFYVKRERSGMHIHNLSVKDSTFI